VDASLRFWAKTYDARERPRDESVESFKPVLHHMLDVAAVAASFLRCQEARLVREAALVAIAPEDYANMIGFLAGLHDLGKFARNFRAKNEALWPASLGAWPGPNMAGPSHWRATGLLLQLDPLSVALASLFPNLRGGESSLRSAVAGHHGRLGRTTTPRPRTRCANQNGSTHLAWLLHNSLSML